MEQYLVGIELGQSCEEQKERRSKFLKLLLQDFEIITIVSKQSMVSFSFFSNH
jgi:hypothetical protein